MTDIFDFSTIYTAIITSNILLILIALIVSNEKILINAGYKLITIFLGLTAVRFLLPIQVPFVTTVPLPQGISNFFVPLFTPLYTIAEVKITPILLITLVWIIGILVQGYRYYKANLIIYTRIFTTGRNVSKDARYVRIMEELYKDKAKLFSIFQIPNLETPLIFGFFKPYILIPEQFDCTDEELAYILKHEVSHYLHHDLLVKCLTRLLTILYWWNPFGYLLYHQVNLVLEMRIDDSLTLETDKETAEYLNCLLHLAEYQDSIFCNPMSNTIAFTPGDENVLTKRFKMLLQRRQKKNWVLNLVLICMVIGIYLFSYLLIFEINVKPYWLDEEVININNLDSYIIDNSNGTYDVYLAGHKIETTDSLEYYSNDIPVYTREEYEHAQQKDNK